MVTTAIPDLMAALVTFIKADVTVNTLVAGRVYGGELPREQAELMPRKAIHVQRSGGVGGDSSYLDIASPRFDFFCYGETPFEAERVWRNLYAALKRMRRNVTSGVLLHHASPAGGSLPLRDPDGGWPINWQPFTVTFSELEAT